MKIISILALAFIVPLTLLGEPSSHGHPFRMRLNAVQITFGNQFHLNYPWTLDEFLPLAVGSELLNSQTFDDYTVYPSPVRSNTPVVSASLVARLNRYEEDRDANLRIGLRYHAGSSRSFQPNHKVSTRTDTLYNA